MVRPLASLVLLLAPVVGHAQTDPALLRFIPPNPKALISADWKALKSTHIGALLREKYIDGDSASAIPGAEFLDDVDRFVLASPATARTDEMSEPPMLVVVRGHFDMTKVRKTLAEHGAKPQMFNSIQVYRPQGKSSRDLAFVLIDAQTILIGDAPSVFAALERNANPTPPDGGSVFVRAKELDSRYDVWAILSGMQAEASDRLMGLLAGGALQSESRSFEAGVSLKNGLLADISLIFPSELEARNMVSEFSKLMKAAVKEKVGGPAMVDFEKRLKVAADGATARISLRMSPQDFEKNAQLFASARQQQAVAAAQVKAAPEPAPVAPKAAPQMIKIDGLDDGPREIRLKPDQR